MAKEIVQLEGGPDNGVELVYNVPPALPAQITYSGSVYDNANSTKTDSAGNTVHRFTFDQSASSGIPAPKLHNGWNSLRRAMDKKYPASIQQARRNTNTALRVLGRRRKVGR